MVLNKKNHLSFFLSYTWTAKSSWPSPKSCWEVSSFFLSFRGGIHLFILFFFFRILGHRVSLSVDSHTCDFILYRWKNAIRFYTHTLRGALFSTSTSPVRPHSLDTPRLPKQITRCDVSIFSISLYLKCDLNLN